MLLATLLLDIKSFIMNRDNIPYILRIIYILKKIIKIKKTKKNNINAICTNIYSFKINECFKHKF